MSLAKIEPIPESESIHGVMQPAGYRLLVRIPNLAEQMANHENLIMPGETRSLEEAAQLVGQVIALGKDAYKDKTRFPTGEWCKEGDFVMFRMYAGTRFVVGKVEYRLINDDTVQGVVRGDPTEIERP